MNCSWWAAKWRQGVFVLAAMAGAVSSVWGQDELPQAAIPEPQLTITSKPAGVVVELHGQYDWIGTAPWTVYRPLRGLYRVKAHRPGYNSWSREVVLGPDGVKSLHISLSRKSRIMAVARSAILPGWGQRYSEREKRGNIFMGAEAGALLAMYIMNLRYDDKVDDYAVAEKAYMESDQTTARLPVLRRELESQAGRADDAWDDYKVAETVAMGIYALGVLDALFNGPDRTDAYSPSTAELASEESTELAPTLGWDASWTPEGTTRLGLRFDF